VGRSEVSVRISEAAERLGITPRTIKYYEELGLLTPERSGGNYREYDEDDLERLERIRNMQKLGFSLAGIRELLKFRRQVDERGQRRLRTADLEAVCMALEQELAEVRQRVAAARREAEQGERLANDLQMDIATCRERLALRRRDPVPESEVLVGGNR
jgi:MerR family transcriptional regulator, repressor of the yfmOP operon